MSERKGFKTRVKLFRFAIERLGDKDISNCEKEINDFIDKIENDNINNQIINIDFKTSDKTTTLVVMITYKLFQNS